MELSPFNKIEITILPLVLVYFLFYPRDTVSDFVVCSSLCFLILMVSKQIRLEKPDPKPLCPEDIILACFTLPTFAAAWFYAWQKGKLNLDQSLLSIQISALYFYYAWIQHFLAQRYTAVRMHLLALHFPGFLKMEIKPEAKAAFMTGAVFGILHIPYPDLMLPAALGGSAYAYYFLKTGRLWAVVSSHALIASAWIFWGLDSNAFEEFTFLF